jgi:hypothetical protein
LDAYGLQDGNWGCLFGHFISPEEMAWQREKQLSEGYFGSSQSYPIPGGTIGIVKNNFQACWKGLERRSPITAEYARFAFGLTGDRVYDSRGPMGRAMSGAMSKHPRFDEVRTQICARIRDKGSCCLSDYEDLQGPCFDYFTWNTTNGKLGDWGLVSVRPDIGPVSFAYEFSIFLGGQLPDARDEIRVRGNTGSFRYSWQVNSIDCNNNNASVTFRAYNCVGAKSGSYDLLPNNFLWTTTTDQHFIWTETIDCSKYPTPSSIPETSVIDRRVYNPHGSRLENYGRAAAFGIGPKW